MGSAVAGQYLYRRAQEDDFGLGPVFQLQQGQRDWVVEVGWDIDLEAGLEVEGPVGLHGWLGACC
ncbi:MAG: hypothetical protein C1943_14140 [Halochromatium sp.]|nr:hypothetical protein [Halochromatium sp.]